MQILTLSFFVFFFFTTSQCFAPSPAPGNARSSAVPPEMSVSPSPNPSSGAWSHSSSPGPMVSDEENDGESPGEMLPNEGENKTIKWCVVREESEDCEKLVSFFQHAEDYTWKCVKKYTTQDCLESIKKRESDLISLEAGLAYTAFLNYSMKAIANEVYYNHAKSYTVVAIVNRKMCKKGISLMNFKGKRSCHGGYATAAGWNYPINEIRKLTESAQMDDKEISQDFFSKVCAPSDFEESGICNGCGNKNGSCQTKNPYYGNAGAFRCLIEELGDIAFVKADTALLYSMEGPYNQSWSAKSVRDFMYLCPQGGCREINGYPGSCSFGDVPANVIMASNSIPNKKRLLVLQLLTNSTWINALYGKESNSSRLISPSTQEFAVVKNLTRTYLGTSAMISQSLQELSIPNAQGIPPTAYPTSGTSALPSSCLKLQRIISFVSILTVLASTAFSL